MKNGHVNPQRIGEDIDLHLQIHQIQESEVDEVKSLIVDPEVKINIQSHVAQEVVHIPQNRNLGGLIQGKNLDIAEVHREKDIADLNHGIADLNHGIADLNPEIAIVLEGLDLNHT